MPADQEEVSVVALEEHPLARAFPAMSPEEYAALKQDVAEHGVRQPVVLYEGKLLDGRHRYRAGREAGREVPTEPFVGDDPVAFVLSANLQRRNLTASQRAAVAAELVEELAAEAEKRRLASLKGQAPLPPQGGNGEKGRAAAHAAKKVGAAPRTTERAKRVKDNAPDLHEQVKAGAITVKAAEKKLQERTPEGQRQKAAKDEIARIKHEVEHDAAVGQLRVALRGWVTLETKAEHVGEQLRRLPLAEQQEIADLIDRAAAYLAVVRKRLDGQARLEAVQ